MPVGLIAAGVGAAGAIAGGVISSNATKSASNTAAAASNSAQAEQAREFDASQAAIKTGVENASAVQRQSYDSSTALNAPSLVTGNSALSRLAQLYGVDSVDAGGNTVPGNPGTGVDPNATFYQSPDYKFALDQGIKGLDAGASARGMLDSGATRKAEIKYGGNLASSNFNSYASRLASLAGIGQDAVNRGINNNQNFATLYGNTQINQGTNLAATGTNYANNYASSVQNAANNQANATLANGANTSNAINGLAGSAGSFLNNNYAGKSVFGSSYIPPGQTSGPSMGWQ